jgi:hemin uptake protein HemP
MSGSTENCVPARQDQRPSTPEAGARKISCTGHRIDSRELFVDTREVLIHHGDDVYRLRLTAQNKLILTK